MASKCCRMCGCCSCLIVAFVISLIVWLAIMPNNVDMSLMGVEVGEFNLSSAGLDWDLNVTVRLRNGNENVQVAYKYVSTILWYRNQRLAVQAFPGPGFQQGQKSTVLTTLRLQPQRQVQLSQDRVSAMADDIKRAWCRCGSSWFLATDSTARAGPAGRLRVTNSATSSPSALRPPPGEADSSPSPVIRRKPGKRYKMQIVQLPCRGGSSPGGDLQDLTESHSFDHGLGLPANNLSGNPCDQGDS